LADAAPLAQAWSDFVAAWDAGDDAACLTCVQRWIERWDEAFWANDFSAFPAIYHEDVEAVNRSIFPMQNDFTGIEGFQRMRDEIIDAASNFRFEIQEFRRAGDRFAGLGQFRARGRYTRLVLRAPLAVVWTMRDGKITRVEAYLSHGRALRDAGMAQPG